MKLSWEKCNLDIPFSEYEQLIGIPFFDILEKLKIDQKEWEKIKNLYDKTSSQEIDKVEKFENVDELFSFLDTEKITYSLFTSKTKQRTIQIKNKLFEDNHFLEIVTPEDLDKNSGKPKGVGLEKIMNKLKLLNGEVLYVGDTYFDYLCAKDVKVDFIFAGWGYGNNPGYDLVEANTILEFINKIKNS
tara:strand:- start:33056 stop:33619 length:564 start_codon:yes stop_codon:yes gene_type:complete